MTRIQRLVRMVTVWLTSAAVAAVLVFFVSGGPRMFLLSRHFSTTTGVVTRVDRANHGSVTVRYAAGSRQYERAFSPYEQSVGQPVIVYYHAENPDLAAIENPSDLLLNDLSSSALAALVFGSPFALLILSARFAEFWRRPWKHVPFSPRFVTTGILIGVLIGGGSTLYSGQMHGLLWVRGGMIIGGCALLCWRAFQIGPSVGWRGFAQSSVVAGGVTLVLLGQLLLML